jgi:hypothetical protein
MNNSDDDLPVNFMSEEEEKPAPVEAQVKADFSLDEEEDFSSLEIGDEAFTSIENSEDFNGLDGEANSHTPPAEAQASYINEYGVRVRGAAARPPLKDDDEIHFSVNLGDN